jgi:hypothetical protein
VRLIHSAILVFAGLVLGIPAAAQKPPEPPVNSEFTTRFSYENTWNVSYEHTWDGLGRSDELRRLCFAFSRNGEYRILRQKKNSGPEEAFQGILGKSRQDHLQQMLNSAAFRNSSGNGPGVILNGAETFVAKVPREGKEQYVTWTNRDRRDPFPAPAAEMIEWMRSFDTAGGQSIRPETLNICPHTARPLLPSSSN